MTTRTYSSAYNNTNTTNFRAWGSELSTNLALVGLIPVADSGTINWTTVTFPGSGTPAGYEMWSLSDSSLFFKIEYGHGTNNAIGFWITIGQGSDSAGNLTGLVSVRREMGRSSINDPVSAFITYICVTNDFFGLIFKANGCGGGGSNDRAQVAFMISKTTNGSGVATGLGYGWLYSVFNAQPWTLDTYRLSGSARQVVNNTTSFCMPAGNLTSSVLDNGDQQVYQVWGAFPDSLASLHLGVVTRAEVPAGTAINVAMVGPTNHTLLAIYDAGNVSCVAGATPALFGLAMLWE